MPLNVSAIYANKSNIDYTSAVWLSVTGSTAGNLLASSTCAGGSVGVTAGYVSAISGGTALIPTEVYYGSYSVNVTTSFAATYPSFFRVRDMTSGATVGVVGTSAADFNDRGSWTVSQGSTGNITITCTSLGSSSICPVLISLANINTALAPDYPPEIWQISILNKDSDELSTTNVRPPLGGGLPETIFNSSVITKTDTYYIKIMRRLTEASSIQADTINVIIPTALTVSAVTSGGSSNMFSWLDNSYWYLTDLQVNLGTRAVTHRHGTIQLRPADTINFAILFHDGTSGINPQATDIKLAVRSSNNTSPYHFWSAATVSTVTVSGDVYYAITVTASDDDLLSAQAANLLAGSNADQSLLGEIQWTTTRGTFSSDTFTINVPSEVVREPDV